jgi:hypothetical protein
MLLQQASKMGETSWVKQVRQWVREQRSLSSANGMADQGGKNAAHDCSLPFGSIELFICIDFLRI